MWFSRNNNVPVHGDHSVKICTNGSAFSVAFSRASVLTHFESAYANFIVRGRHDGTATPTNAGTSDVAMRLWRASRRRCRGITRRSTMSRSCVLAALIAGPFIFCGATCWCKMPNYKRSRKLIIVARSSCAMGIDTRSFEWSRDTITGGCNLSKSHVIIMNELHAT